ncbi:helix-turn-helix transcriptional regulator [Kordiimonas marina]|uniref:helix-turn-helix transcriptional regulator n=1 Tax=Kordiimonas marina TaxID=2872312 RepID=UPI001FF179D4|nr:metalloregulator ArsR/SmtB family transcription factor [Kordiimonas marina]MCJ9430411.1 transcriptional regulator [Kordiimonas marina]
MSTRETILTELKRRGHAQACELAETLDLTPMAVRQHLYQMQDEGMVTCCATPSPGRGRPPKHWQLTEKSDVYFQDAHRDLSLDLIDSIRTVMGQDALDTLIAHRTQKQEARYGNAMKDAHGLKARLEKLAAERVHDGYMAEVQESDDGSLLLLENHCPICEAAKACSGLCKQELMLFQNLIGEDATVERTEHVLKGGRRCAYRITPSR